MKSKLVFVVDDDRLIQNILEYTINGKEGFNVRVFQSGEDCLQNLGKKPDIIVLDHYFASKGEILMTGLEAIVEIRKIAKSVPIIILSDQSSDSVIEEYFSKGATSYIPKRDYFISTLIDTFDKVLPN